MVQICSIWCIYMRSRSPKHIFRSSRLFLEYPDTFFRLSRHFLHHLETLQFIPSLFRSSGNFPVHLYTSYIIWIFCIVSGHFPKYPEILQPIMSFLQKLSGQHCWRADGVFLTLSITFDSISYRNLLKFELIYGKQLPWFRKMRVGGHIL